MKPITYREAFQLLGTGLRVGLFPSFTYVLGTHVLYMMQTRGVRQILLRPEDVGGKVLMDADNLFIAGRVDEMIHEGMGAPTGDSRFHISVHYIDALQKLHWGRILQSDILESRLDDPGAEEVHFTMLPELKEGIHWTERTPVCYRLPNYTLQEVIDQAVSTPSKDTIYQKVQFRDL